MRVFQTYSLTDIKFKQLIFNGFIFTALGYHARTLAKQHSEPRIFEYDCITIQFRLLVVNC
ncbi:Uncharacterised protein [Shewanella baltica]|nr:Uncharacterised protein [Shewanella baltica]